MNIVPTALNAQSETVFYLRAQLLLPDNWQFQLKALIHPYRFWSPIIDKACHFTYLNKRGPDDSTLNKNGGSTELNNSLITYLLNSISYCFDHVQYLQVVLTLKQRRYDMTELRQKMIRAMELRNLSKHSQRAYLAAVTGISN